MAGVARRSSRNSGSIPLKAGWSTSRPGWNWALLQVSGPRGALGERPLQPVRRPDVYSIFRPKRPLATVNEHLSHQSREFRDRTQSGHHAAVIAVLGLDLDRRVLSASSKQKVELRPVRKVRRPIVQIIEQFTFLAVRAQEVQNPALVERTPFLGGDRPVQILPARTKPGSTR